MVRTPPHSHRVIMDDILNKHRQVSINFLETCGNFAVRAPRGQKDPGGGWDPKNNDAKKHGAVLNRLREGNDNLGVHLFGKLVDVDIDNDDPNFLAAFEMLAPRCGHIYGRGERRRTHRIYALKDDFIPDDHPVIKHLNRIPSIKMEIRGGDMKRGEYSLLPGSIHTSGDEYRWEDLASAEATPSLVDINQLIRAARFAGVVALLAPYWVEGSRNDLVMPFSGFLYRAHMLAGELGLWEDAKDSPMRYDEAETLLKTLMAVAGDDETYMRTRTLKRTYQRGASGANNTGGGKLQELTGDAHISARMYGLLVDNPQAQKIAEFQEEFALVEGTSTVVNLFAIRDNWHNFNPQMDVQAFKFSYGDRTVTLGEKKVRLVDIFPALSSSNRVRGFTLAPDQPVIFERDGSMWVNEWRGWAYEPHADPVTPDEVSWFTSYLMEVVCSNDPRAYDWVVNWIAHIFQCPVRKAGTALVLLGLPGAGKSFLSKVLRLLIGDGHSCVTEDVSELGGRFNQRFQDKLLIHCEEAMHSRQRGLSALLKSYITDSSHSFEAKNKDRRQRDTYMRFLFTSNEISDAIYLPDGRSDRRYTVLRVSDDRREDLAYWGPRHDLLGENSEPVNVEALRKLLRWFMDYPLDWALIRRPYLTKAKDQMVQSSWTPFDQWLANMASQGHPLTIQCHTHWFDAVPDINYTGPDVDRTEWPKYVSTQALVEDYSAFMRHVQPKDRAYKNDRQIIDEFISRGLTDDTADIIRKRASIWDDRTGVKKQIRPRLREIFPMERLCQYLEAAHGVTTTPDADDLEEDMIDTGNIVVEGAPDY